MKKLIFALILMILPSVVMAFPPMPRGATQAYVDAQIATTVTNPMDSAGDIIIGGALGAPAKLDAGTDTYFLQAKGASSPIWRSPANVLSDIGAAPLASPALTGDSTLTDATPTLTLQDSDNAAGTAAINFNSSGGSNDVVATLGVEAGGSASVGFMELDGVTETVDFLKNITLANEGVLRTSETTEGHTFAIQVYDNTAGSWKPALTFTNGITGAYKVTLGTGATFDGIGTLTLTSGTLNLPSSNASPATTAGQIRHDSTVTGLDTGGLAWYDGDEIRYLVDLETLPVDDDYVVAYDADNDIFYMKADANSGSATAWDDIADPDADATIAFAGYEATITSTLDEASHTVLTIYNTDDDRANATTILKLTDDDTGDAQATYIDLVADADGTPASVFSINQSTGIASTLNFATTGNINGALEILSDDVDLAASQCYGSIDKVNGTEDIQLPAAVVGMNVMIYSDDATVKSLKPAADENIWLNGVDLTDNNELDSPGAIGNYVVLVCFSTGNWYTVGISGTWVDGGES